MALITDLVSLESVLSKKLRDRRMSASFLGEKGSDERIQPCLSRYLQAEGVSLTGQASSWS